MTTLHPDYFFPPEPNTLASARRLYECVKQRPVHAEFGSKASALEMLARDPGRFKTLAVSIGPAEDFWTDVEIPQEEAKARVLPFYFADQVIDPDDAGFVDRLDHFGQLTNCDAYTWKGYLEAHRVRRELFSHYGAFASRHRHPSAATTSLNAHEWTALFRRVCIGKASAADFTLFRAGMLMEMARMSADDGLDMHLFCGQGSAGIYTTPGGRQAQIPLAVEYTRALRPLLESFGDTPRFKIVLFTLDESALSNQLVPLAGVFPSLRLGLSNGCDNSPDRLRKFRETTSEGLGFARTYRLTAKIDENDDPVQSDIARRIDCADLAGLVATHRLSMTEAEKIIVHWAD
jgi:glucuronate isomerase